MVLPDNVCPQEIAVALQTKLFEGTVTEFHPNVIIGLVVLPVGINVAQSVLLSSTPVVNEALKESPDCQETDALSVQVVADVAILEPLHI